MHRSLMAITCALILHTGATTADTITFTNGAAEDAWSSPQNWDLNTLPTSNDFVQVFDHSVSITTELAQAEYLDVRRNGVLNLSGGEINFGNANNRWFWVGWNSPGIVNQTGGKVTGNSNGAGSNVDLVVDQQGVYNLLAGEVDIQDDLWLLDGSTFTIAGSSNLLIGDDFRTIGNSQLNVVLQGNVTPTITVLDRLRLNSGNLTLNIDATQWTGGDGMIQLFDVQGNVNGDFSEVIVNGANIDLTDPAAYSNTNGQVFVQVTEPSSPVMALFGIAAVVVCWSRSGRQFANHSMNHIRSSQTRHDIETNHVRHGLKTNETDHRFEIQPSSKTNSEANTNNEVVVHDAHSRSSRSKSGNSVSKTCSR